MYPSATHKQTNTKEITYYVTFQICSQVTIPSFPSKPYFSISALVSLLHYAIFPRTLTIIKVIIHFSMRSDLGRIITRVAIYAVYQVGTNAFSTIQLRYWGQSRSSHVCRPLKPLPRVKLLQIGQEVIFLNEHGQNGQRI